MLCRCYSLTSLRAAVEASESSSSQLTVGPPAGRGRHCIEAAAAEADLLVVDDSYGEKVGVVAVVH